MGELEERGAEGCNEYRISGYLMAENRLAWKGAQKSVEEMHGK